MATRFIVVKLLLTKPQLLKNMKSPKKIAVLIESHFDGTEPGAFLNYFPANGYSVEFVSNLRGAKEKAFANNDDPSKMITVTLDISTVNLSTYSGLILVGGYAMDMLRYEVHVEEGKLNEPVATQFVRKAMAEKHLIIGTICHSLWIFTPAPDLLKDRKVTCSHNIMHDVQNAGGILVYDDKRKTLVSTHVDGNLVTGRHPYVVEEFMDVFYDRLIAEK